MPNSRKILKKNGQKSNKLKWSFAGTIFVLAVMVGYVLSTQGPAVNEIPSNIHFLNQEWMGYIPSNAVFVQEFNVTRLLQLNSKVFASKSSALMNLSIPSLIVNISDIKYLVSVSFNGTSGENSPTAGVEILIPSGSSIYNTVLSTLDNANLSKRNYSGFTIYSVSVHPPKSGFVTQYIVLANGYIFYQETSTTSGLNDLENVLDSANLGQLMEQPAVRKTLGLLETLAPSNLGFSIRMFPGVIQSQIAGKVLGIQGTQVRETLGLMFSNSSSALSKYDQTRQVYYGMEVDIYENYLVVTSYTNTASLQITDFSP